MGSIGEWAALATAFCWMGSALSFEAASARIGSVPVNLIRLVIAAALLAVLGLVLHGRPLPLDASAHAWGWLSVSGLVGFFLGDLALFRAFVLIGARLSLLVMCLAPPLTAVLGLLFLGERLDPVQVAGMALTVAGVAWTVLERSPASDPRPARGRLPGVLLALAGAAGQAGGLILSKIGMEQLSDPFAASQIRGLAGIAGFAVLFTVAGWWPRVRAGLRDRRGVLLTGAGAFFGPFLGVSLSLLAIHTARAGVAAAIMSISPVLILAVARLRGERVSLRAALGTLVAVAGVAVLFRASA